MRVDITEQDLRIDALWADLQRRVEQCLCVMDSFRTPVRLHGDARQFDVGEGMFGICGNQTLEDDSSFAECFLAAVADGIGGIPEVSLVFGEPLNDFVDARRSNRRAT